MKASWNDCILFTGGALNCPSCGGDNRDGARFCISCGAALALRCATCNNELPPQARFCDGCGSPVTIVSEEQPVAAARKVVTVLFADMTGSTSLEEELDAERVRALVDRFYAALRAEVEKRGGRVVKFTGDGLMAAFGVPEVHEDDALRAIEAASAMCTACNELATQTGLTSVSLKVGINTGEVVVIEDDDDVVGDSVNVASRLEGAARAGEILVGEETWRLTRSTARYEPIEPLTLKGKSEPVPAYRLLTISDGVADTLAAPFIGREAELETLSAAFDAAVAANAARLVTIVGSPGLGKTRLTREFAERLAGRAVVRETRCDPTSATFAPIAEALREANAIPESASEEEVVAGLLARIPEDEPDRERMATLAAGVLGAGQPGSTEETFWALRRMIETAAARELPRVLVLEDLHWAEPLLLDLVEHLAEWIREGPVLLIGTARPELRDLRPSLVEGGRAHAVLALEGLDEQATQRLAVGLLGTEDVPPDLVAKIPQSTEGNPLFVREFVRMLVDDGVLQRTASGWDVSVDVDAIEVPPTIQSLLAARVDRLRTDERAVLELAAVVGKEFYRGALDELAPPAVRDQVESALESLRRKELVEPAGTYWIDEPVYRFHHVLIRDAAYRRLLKETRADVHERTANWLERKTSGVLGEHEELIGFHLEQAHEYKTQLATPDERLGVRAADLLGEAARRALDRDDLTAAASLSGRALARLPADHQERSTLLITRCEALLSMGDVASGAGAVEELEKLADTQRLRAWAACFAGQLAGLIAPERLQEIEKRVSAAAVELADLGDPAGAAKAHTVHGSTLARLGRFAECEAALDAALTAARDASDRRRITAVLGSAPLAALWGPNPVSRAGGRCLDLVRLSRITTGSPGVEVTSTRCQAVLEAFRGRTDAARRMLRSARRTLTELGLKHELLETEQFAGVVELVAGEPAAALPHLSEAHDGFRFVGVDVLAAQTAALLARAYLRLGELADAEAFANESEELGGQDLKASISWRAVKAELLARRGEFEEARFLAESAVELASRTDALIDHGDACAALAAVCAASGDATGARSASERAFALYERKGATALVDRPPPAPPAEVAAPASGGEPENMAVRGARRIADLFERRDWDAMRSELADNLTILDRRRVVGLDFVNSREKYIEQFKIVADLGTRRIESSVIATRGERLALLRCTYLGDELGSGAFGVALLLFFEFDAAGRHVAGVLFDIDSLDEAITELDERFVAGEGASQADMLGIWTGWMRAYNDRDWDAMRSLMADDFTLVDERPVSLGRVDGKDGYIQAMTQLIDLIPGRRGYMSQFSVLTPAGSVGTAELSGPTADGIATSETMHMMILVSGGRMTRMHTFAFDGLDRALERFDELTTAAPATGATTPQDLENASTRARERFEEYFASRDWSGLESLLTEDVHFDDRRAGLRHTADGAVAVVELLKPAADTGTVRFEETHLAIRGDRLSLSRVVARGRGGPAGLETEFLSVQEIDADNRISAIIDFGPDDLGAALSELDARFAAGEGTPYADTLRVPAAFARALGSRDWDALREVLSSDLVFHDHRAASLGLIDGRDEWIASLEIINEVTTSHVIARYHAIDDDRVLAQLVNRIAPYDDRGGYETTFQALFEIRDGCVTRLEVFPIDALDAARTAFHEASRGRSVMSNACLDAVNRELAAYEAHDWAAVGEGTTDDAINEDRRSGLKFRSVGRRAYVEALQSLAAVGAVPLRRQVVASRGERLCLTRVLWGSRDREYASEAELLRLHEIDESGRICAYVGFDIDDADAAFDELDARYLAGEGAPYAEILELGSRQRAALAAGDWKTYRELVDPDVVLVDHRPASLGELRGFDDVLAALRAFPVVSGLRPRAVAVHAIASDRSLVETFASAVSEDGTEVEMAHLRLQQLRARKVVRIELFPEDRLDEACARFEELGGEGPSSIELENAAARLSQRIEEMLRNGAWERAEALIDHDVVSDDRRRGVASTGRGRDAFVGNFKAVRDLGIMVTSDEVLAVRGDRLALLRGTGIDEVGNEMAAVMLIEQERGRASRMVWFDPDDLDAAFAELDARYFDGEGSGYRSVLAPFIHAQTAANDRNWPEFREGLAPSLVFVDHRPASLGAMGRDQWVESMKALVEVVPSWRTRTATFPLLGADTVLSVLRNPAATDEEGVVEFVMYFLVKVQQGRLSRVEVFPIEDRRAAESQFEALAAGRIDRSIENAATRALDRVLEALTVKDRPAARSVYAEGFVYEDRRHGLGARLVGEEAWRVSSSFADVGMSRARHDHLAIRGDRLALVRSSMSDRDGFEIQFAAVNEIGSDGRLIASVVFDGADLDAAFAELDRRFMNGEAAPFASTWEAIRRTQVAYNERDWDALREVLAPDVAISDRRPAGSGSWSGIEEWISYIRQLIDLAPDARTYISEVHRLDERGGVHRYEVYGTNVQGGTIELPSVAMVEVRDGVMARIEQFPIDQLELALSRFDELDDHDLLRRRLIFPPEAMEAALAELDRAYAAGEGGQGNSGRGTRGLENECTRVLDRVIDASLAGDAELAESLYADDYFYRDVRPVLTHEMSGPGVAKFASRGMGFLDIGGSSMQFIPLAIRADRLALHRVLMDVRGFELAFLAVNGINQGGRLNGAVIFDIDDYDAAVDELDERFAAGEGSTFADEFLAASALIRAYDRRDWALFRSVLSDDFVLVDHRPVSLGTMGPDEWVDSAKIITELGPGLRIGMSEVVAIAPGRVAYRVFATGTTRDDVEVEVEFYQVGSVRNGRLTRLEFFPMDRRDDALTCFNELDAIASQSTLDNACARTVRSLLDRFDSRDWPGMVALFAEDVVSDDRRPGLGYRAVGRSGVVEQWKVGAEMGVGRVESTVLATRGERLALLSVRLAAANRDSHFEAVVLNLVQIDEFGLIKTSTAFDPDDLDSAFAKLDEYFTAGEGNQIATLVRLANDWIRSIRDRDWDSNLIAEDFIMIDHRLASMGQIHGRDAWMKAMRVFGDLASSTTSHLVAYHKWSENGGVAEVLDKVLGDEGAEYELSYHLVGFSDGERISRLEIFPLDALPEALARFEELDPRP